MAQSLHKHVFLDYSEYQRLLELKERNETLSQKIKSLEKIIAQLEQRDQEGKGLQKELEEKTQKEQLITPLVGIAESITLPPNVAESTSTSSKKSLKGDGTKKPKTKTNKWYFIGLPEYARK